MTADAVGGVWNYALELCHELGGRGVEILLATLGPLPSSEQRAAVARLPHVTLRESAHRLEWMEHPWADVERAGAWLLELAEEFSPELIHLNGYSHAALPWKSPVVAVAHSCVLSWWRAVRREPAPADWDDYRSRVTAGLQAASVVVAPTNAMRDMLIREYGALPRVRVISNGCDPSRFARLHKEPSILSVGRLWDEAKNVAALGEVAPRVRWPIRVVGDSTGPDGKIRKWANMESLGRRDSRQLVELYGHASIYALPARYEPFGLSVLEAAFSGCALVLGDVPSLRELWHDAAVFVPPDDSEALEHELNRLIDHPSSRDTLGALALERAATFTSSRMAENYFGVYAQALRTACAPVTNPPAPVLV